MVGAFLFLLAFWCDRFITTYVAGPDPRGALHLIDRIGLYHTIFANHHDQVLADISTWSLAYNSLARLLPSNSEQKDVEQVEHMRHFLIGDDSSAYYAWMIAAFAPWTSVPARITKGKQKSPPTRAVEVGRESLRSDNKTLNILRDASSNYEDIIRCKSSLLANTISGNSAEIRQHIGLRIRSWGKEWKLCVVLAMLQEAMKGRDFTDGT